MCISHKEKHIHIYKEFWDKLFLKKLKGLFPKELVAKLKEGVLYLNFV